MPRWQPDARRRLEEAALDLFSEQGYDATTVEDIARRAGVTKRTFFRHFADKREVLFGGGDAEAPIAKAVMSAPPSDGPLAAVRRGLDTMAAALDQQGETAARRIRIVRASPELSERQLIKFASLAEAIAGALRGRGVDDHTAVLTAEAGITVLRVAAERWIRGSKAQSLRQLFDEAVAELRAIASRSR